MKKTDLARLLLQSMNLFLFHRNTPLFATLILTDRCNLSCRYCRLHNYHAARESSKEPYYTFEQICEDMKKIYKKGVRILCFSGGEIALWEYDGHTVRELVEVAKKIGFVYVAIATNGTIYFDYGAADFILISIDGSKEMHDSLRGESYDCILGNIRKANETRPHTIVIFMEINKINYKEIQAVCKLAKENPDICAASFNFHTPFHGTENLTLTKEEKSLCCRELEHQIKEGYPIANMKSVFRYLEENDFPTPCRQLMVMDAGEEILCNRCSKENLCDQCGYFETAEIAMMFDGKLRVWWDAIRTYRRFL